MTESLKLFKLFVVAVLLLVLAGCASAPSTTGLGARQQSLSIVIEADHLAASPAQPAVSVTVSGMSYDGTRGDVGGTKAATETGDATAESSRQLNLSQYGEAGTAAERLKAAVAGKDAGNATAAFVPDTEVPAGLDLTLDEWNEMKKNYLECPGCMVLSPEVEAALKEAVGK